MSSRERQPSGRVVVMRALAVVGAGVVVLLLVVGAAVGWVATRDDERLGRLDRDLATRSRRVRARRWRRPVLRGPAVEGNATDLQREALAALPLENADLDLDDFAELRAATRARVAWTRPVLDHRIEAEDAAAEVEHERLKTGIGLLLALASRQSPGECLAACADAVRILQDRLPGRPTLELQHLGPTVIGLVTSIAPRCAGRASRQELRTAAAELATLALHPPPVGWSLELDLLRGVVEMLSAARTFPGILRRPGTLNGVEHNLRFASRYRAITAAGYPGSFAVTERESVLCRGRFGVVCEPDTPKLHADARQQASLRALAVGLAALALTGPSAAPPPALQDPGLCDPFTGGPLRWRPLPGGGLHVYSVGPDLVDDGAGEAADPLAGAADVPASDDEGVRFAPGA